MTGMEALQLEYLLCQNFAANGRDEGFAMKLQGTGPWAATPVTSIPHCRIGLLVLLFVVMATLSQSASSQAIQAVPVANRVPLTAEQVMRNLAQMNRHRVEALHAYEGTGTYRAKYEGFPGARKAEMIVNLKYLPPGKIEFVIQSATGSKLIIDRVFKKLLEAEKEESSPKIERRSALTDANYRFTLIGEKNWLSGPAYVLEVEPTRKDKFLYHGRIWVDAGDFAVVRLEAKPSQNLSFWTRRADIVEVYTKVSDFWLPAHNHSVAAIRLGGHAELTIDYKDYEITDASQVSGLEAPQSAPQAATGQALK
jgi:outer membrane lipoprotein-sorting protein